MRWLLLFFICMTACQGYYGSIRRRRDFQSDADNRDDYEAVFGRQLFDYYYEPNHTFMAKDVPINIVCVKNNSLKFYDPIEAHRNAFQTKIINQLSNYLSISDHVAIHVSRHNMYKDVPDYVYPVLTIVVDNDLYRQFNQNISEILVFVADFWMKVDLLYRQLSKPKVRLNIGRIVIVKGKDSMPTFNNSQQGQSQYKDLSTAYPDVFGKNTIYVLMKSLHANSDTVTSETGLFNQSCTVILPHLVVRVSNLADVNADVRTAAHELSHQFGTLHELGSITDLSAASTANSLKFFYPNKERIAHHFRDNKCFHKKPDILQPIDIVFPGYFQTPNEQCNIEKAAVDETMTVRNHHGDSVCKALPCIPPLGKHRPLAMDGTSCDNRQNKYKICINRKCVSVPNDLLGYLDSKEGYINELFPGIEKQDNIVQGIDFRRGK